MSLTIEDVDVLDGTPLLDRSQVDDGTAWEAGYFYRGKPEGAKIIGVRTDLS